MSLAFQHLRLDFWTDRFLKILYTERKHNPSSHHAAADHVPEKKFKSEALLSTLTSDASKENAQGNFCYKFK